MRLLSTIAIAVVWAWMGIHVKPAAAQTFEERWSIIPKAKAERFPRPTDTLSRIRKRNLRLEQS
jgi:hypothetical protein